MRLLKDSQRVELDAAAEAAVYYEAERMVRAGVVLTPEYWESLTEIERNAFILARNAVEIEHQMTAARLLTVKSVEEMLPILEQVDGGRSVTAEVMRGVVSRMSKTMDTPMFARQYTKAEIK